jgi:lysophospholipid acyltransferase (LPLAT)-like uncharacterized protein
MWLSIATCKVSFEGEENIPENSGRIYAFWHENLVLYFSIFTKVKERQVWLNHPVWFMKPIHIMLGWMGVEKLALGSSGHSGKDALKEVIEDLKNAYSTVINPDGPRGPIKVLKAGVLIMAAESGLPIIPMTFHCSKEYRLNTWDKKRCPVPFSKVVVKYGAPIYVSSENEANSKLLAEALSKQA